MSSTHRGLLPAALLLAACGGGGGSGTPAAIAPTLLIQQPASDITVSLGGFTDLRFIAQDPDSQATVVLLGDGDGDFATDSDQFPLQPLVGLHTTASAATQQVLLDVFDIPATFSIFAVAVDAGHAPVVAAAPGRVTVANAAYAQHVGGPLDDGVNAVGAAADGSYVITGGFRATAEFGTGPTATTLTMTNRDPNMFVARYTADGRVLWAKKCDSFQSGGERIAVAPDGSCVVLGNYSGTPSFPASVGEGSRRVTLPHASFCAFICRYDAAGQVVYAMPLSQQSNVSVGRAAVAADGSCVVVGSFTGSMVIGGGANQVILDEQNGRGFIARFASDGTIVSTSQVPVPLSALAILEDGGMALGGAFSGTVTITLGTSPRTVTATGGADMLLLRYTSNGELRHLHQAGGTHPDCRVSPSAILARGRFLHVIGNLNMAAAFGSLTLSPTHPNVFVVDYRDDNGFVTDAFLEGGATSMGAEDAAMLPDGSFVVAGTYSGTATFDQLRASNPIERTAVGPFDPYLARFASDGEVDWVATPQGPGQDFAHAVTVLPDGSCLVVGHGENGLSFTPGQTVVMPNSYPSGYVARLNANGTFF